MATLTERTVGELVVERPSRARALESFGIDYCCGGKATLRAACAKAGADESAVIDALERASAEPAGAVDWSRAGLRDLIGHIIAHHHERVRAELARCANLVSKVVAAHGERDSRLRELETTHRAFAERMLRHMEDEEQRVFPAIATLEDGGATRKRRLRAASVLHDEWLGMHDDHEGAGAALRRMRDLTDGFRAGPDACNTHRVMLDSLAWLERDTHEHVHLENNILFPRAKAVADALVNRAYAED